MKDLRIPGSLSEHNYRYITFLPLTGDRWWQPLSALVSLWRRRVSLLERVHHLQLGCSENNSSYDTPCKTPLPPKPTGITAYWLLGQGCTVTSENSGLLAMAWRWQVASSLGSFWIYTDFIQWVSKVSFYYLTPLIHLCYRDPCPCSPWLPFSSTTVWVPLYWSLLEHLDPASRSTRVICCSFKGDVS